MHGEGSQKLPEPPLDLRHSTKYLIASNQSEKIRETYHLDFLDALYAKPNRNQPPKTKQTKKLHDPNEDPPGGEKEVTNYEPLVDVGVSGEAVKLSQHLDPTTIIFGPG